MKALSIKQPWAWAILEAGKDIENRTWPSKYVGPLLIHASKKIDESAMLRFRQMRYRAPTNREHLFLGHIIGMVWMDGSVSASTSEWFVGPYGFRLSRPAVFSPRKYAGRLGIFDIPDRHIDPALFHWYDKKPQQEEL